MSGNIDDSFRIGIALAKKSLKLYTAFDESDILLCSPLGLRMIIGEEAETHHERDFLSSIEILIVDQVCFWTRILTATSRNLRPM